jgi:hypothetical protein
MSEYEDFQEIAHCGGRVTIIIKCDADGQRSYAERLQHSRPGPAAWVGIYALAPQGIPVLDFKMGGINQPWDPQPPPSCFAVLLGSDSRRCWGHQCLSCQGYFRNGQHSALYPLTCPYCGHLAPAHKFLTPAQRAYVRHYINLLLEAFESDVEPGTEREFVIDMDVIADSGANESRPDFYYTAESQQTRYRCKHCNDFNDIRGRYGYCASCGWRNNAQSLQATFAKLREKLNTGQSSPEDTVKSAVSEFDACCRDMAIQMTKRIPMKSARKADLERLIFHDIESATIKFLKAMFDVDILRGLDDDLPFLRMMMHRRHIFEHNGGVTDERYVRESGDATAREGVLIRETQENAHVLVSCLARMLTTSTMTSTRYSRQPPGQLTTIGTGKPGKGRADERSCYACAPLNRRALHHERALAVSNHTRDDHR